MLTISGGSVGPSVRNCNCASSSHATRRVLRQVRGLVSGGTILWLGNLQKSRPWGWIRHPTPNSLIIVGVFESASLNARAAVRVGHTFAAALEVAAIKNTIDSDLDDDKKNAQECWEKHQTAIRSPISFLQSPRTHQQFQWQHRHCATL